jgi:hypothetical protein
MARHHGEKITRELLGKTFYWPKVKEDVKNYIRTCVKCQSTKSVLQKIFELCKPVPIPLGPFENVSMDFMTCLLKWEGMDDIFVVVDMFSKLTKFTLTHTNATMAGTTKLFFDMWVRHNGMSKVIVNDRDVKFMSKFWMLLMKKAKKKLKLLPSTN